MGRSKTASVVEPSKPDLVGTMLTLQTALGFTLTLVTPPDAALDRLARLEVSVHAARGRAVPGAWAMARLRVHPDSLRLANGRR